MLETVFYVIPVSFKPTHNLFCAMLNLSGNYDSEFVVRFLPLPFSLCWMNGECVMREHLRIHSEKLFCFNEMIKRSCSFMIIGLIQSLNSKRRKGRDQWICILRVFHVYSACLQGLVSKNGYLLTDVDAITENWII